VTETQKHYKLTPNQLHILILLYKFRFTTIPLLTAYKNLKSNSLQRTFDILLAERYVERRFDRTFKIDRKPAIYYLSAKGIATLMTDPRFNSATLHSYYKNKSISNAFMQHTVDTLDAYNILMQSYGNKFEIFTKHEVAYFDDFSKTKPDLYLRGRKEYLIMLAHDTPPFLIRKRLIEYMTHFDEVGWTNGDYPALLFVFADNRNEQRFLDFAHASLDNAGIETNELLISTTTMRTLKHSTQANAIWTCLGQKDAPATLV